jgi:hypothetical protein
MATSGFSCGKSAAEWNVLFIFVMAWCWCNATESKPRNVISKPPKLSIKYRIEIMSTNIINHISIIEAINELTNIGENKIVEKLENILKYNEIPKPGLHNLKDDKSTSYYKIDLSDDELDEIRDVFLDLEVSTLTEDGEATNKTQHYVTLLNNWLSISGVEK